MSIEKKGNSMGHKTLPEAHNQTPSGHGVREKYVQVLVVIENND